MTQFRQDVRPTSFTSSSASIPVFIAIPFNFSSITCVLKASAMRHNLPSRPSLLPMRLWGRERRW